MQLSRAMICYALLGIAGLSACAPRAPEPVDPRLNRLPYPERVEQVPIEKPRELTEIEKLLERRKQEQYRRY